MGYRDYSTAKGHIVDSTGHGDFTTIAAALSAASSGQTIFIRPGTYTENPTLKAGVNLAAYDCDALTPNVIINGKCTFTTAGTVTISGIQLKTNSDFCLAVTGSAASVLYLKNCFIYALNNTAITYTTSNSSASIVLYNCKGDIGTTGITFIVSTSAANINLQCCDMQNNGASTTASSTSSSTIFLDWTNINFPLSTSSTGAISSKYCRFTTLATNTTGITTAGTGTSRSYSDIFFCGTASAISIGTGTTYALNDSIIDSSNSNVITGSGSLIYGGIVFNTNSTMNTSTQTPYVHSNDALKIVTPAAYPYTTVPQDAVILVDTSSARTIIPLASPTTGQKHIIKDSVGSASTNNITITPSGKNIDGVASRTLASNYGSATIVYNGTEWSII